MHVILQDSYTATFDRSNRNWTPTPHNNDMFVKGVQNYMNHRLQAQGHLFLNEVHDALGLPRTIDGQLVGWMARVGDGFTIDFGKKTIFQDGVTIIQLTFNVDGVMYDKIEG